MLVSGRLLPCPQISIKLPFTFSSDFFRLNSFADGTLGCDVVSHAPMGSADTGATPMFNWWVVRRFSSDQVRVGWFFPIWVYILSTWQFFVTFLGWLSDPFQLLSDLQLGDEKVTLDHLVGGGFVFVYFSHRSLGR